MSKSSILFVIVIAFSSLEFLFFIKPAFAENQYSDNKADFNQAKKYFEKGADEAALKIIKRLVVNKFPEGINLLGLMYEIGRGVEEDWEKSFSLYSQAADLGSPKGLYNLALSYEYGIGTTVNLKKAFETMKSAHNAGNPYALFQLALYYQYGIGVATDQDEALRHYQLAADLGVTDATVSIAELYHSWGWNSDAERYLVKALRNPPDFLDNYNFYSENNEQHYFHKLNELLAMVYSEQDREREAVELYKAVLKTSIQLYGENSVEVANNLQNLSISQCSLGFSEKAIEQLKRSRDIYESLGEGFEWNYANGLGNLGYCSSMSKAANQTLETIKYYTKSINQFKKHFPDNRLRETLFVGNLAEVLEDIGDLSEARSMFNDAYTEKKRILGSDHTDLLDLVSSFARFELNQNNFESARKLLDEHFAAFTSEFAKGGFTSESPVRGVKTTEDISLIYAASIISGSDIIKSTPKAFEALQYSKAYSLDNTFNAAALRVGVGSKEILSYLNKLKDLRKQIKVVSNQINQSNTTIPKQAKLIKLQNELDQSLKKQADLEEKLSNQFPRYKELVSPQPLQLSYTQDLLNAKEALFTFVSDDQTATTYAFLITKDDALAYKIDLSETRLEEIVTTLRDDVNLSNLSFDGNFPEFDQNLSYELYSKLFGPVESMLMGREDLLIVPTGPLASLPFNLLITEKPLVSKMASTFQSYQKAEWLPKKYSLTRLPTVSSLRALRAFQTSERAKDPFIGFGDPVLGSGSNKLRGIKLIDIYEGATANLQQLRLLPELPETSYELKSIAKYLGAPPNKVYLREQATETLLKSADLQNTKVVAFATHGLISGEISGLIEPALVFSPPENATELDDGLLKASEVAQLKMNADIVLLSACNTASGEKLGASGISSLARAFIYAGARSLLVTHWSVDSSAAAELTTGMFEVLNKNKGIGRAKAFQKSMLNLIQNAEQPHYSHPAFWAPFSLFGDGQTAQLTNN